MPTRHSAAGPTGFLVHDLAWEHDPVPHALRGAVVAIGNFDGVHRGHAAVVARAVALARRTGRRCVACTFEPHPADYFSGAASVFRLTPETAKAELLEQLGIDGVVVLPFDDRMAATPAEDFVRAVLVDRLAVAGAVVGYDFHFGAGRAGTPAFLAEAGRRHGFAVEVIGKVTADERGTLATVSSTAIRAALERGDVTAAARLLGHDYTVVGEVVHGQKLGRTLGYPTANLRLDPSCRLAHGIYAVTVRGAGLDAGGVASFGRRPTFDNGAPLLETYLFDFTGDLYGRHLEFGFVDWIRPEARFDGIDDLIAAMKGDEARARVALGLRARDERRVAPAS